MASGKRELIDTGNDKRYVRRDEQGRFDEVEDKGRADAQDRKRDAKNSTTSGQGDRGDREFLALGRRLEEVLQALERLREAGFVVAMLGKQLAGLVDGERMPLGVGADIGGGRFVCHALRTNRLAVPFRQMSLRIVASAPPSISHLAPLT